MTDQGNRVVISGISGRFPGSNNISEFQINLLNKVDGITTEHGRWRYDSPKVPQRMGACAKINKFDRVFFGVHSKLSTTMDPASRCLLEHSFEAIMDAGVNPRTLKGANIAVITATDICESEKNIFHHKAQLDGFGIMGSSKAMFPNRISFFLGLTGSSISMDNGCTSGSMALQRAYTAIKNGQCDGAIVAGCMLSLHPHLSFAFRCIELLSPDGYTRCFDDAADGNTRSDGMAVLFLQRASDAKRVYQEIINVRTETVPSFHHNLLLYPTAESQSRLIKDVLEDSNLKPDDIRFVETTGSAIKVVDTAELNALDMVYSKRKEPLPIGSVRSIVGNAVPVNTINSIIKVIAASESGQISPNLHYEKPNSQSKALIEGRLKVVTDLVPWEGEYSHIHNFSMYGVSSDIILKAPNKEKKNYGAAEDDLPRLIIASGRTDEAVAEILNYIKTRPVDVEFLQLLYDIFQSEVDGHLYRGFTIVPAQGLPPLDSTKQEVQFFSDEKKEIWWVFSGMGSQWTGMGKALLRLPTFEASIRKCDAILKPEGYDIYKIITDEDPKTFDNILNSFVGIAAIQIGLVDVLKGVGLEPDYIIGHSVGELGCAYADGCFSAEQMIMAALSRGQASQEAQLVRGSMAAVGLGYEAVKPLCPPDIDVACHNGPESSTISGPAESMKQFVADLTAKGIFAREVPCSNIAYHSRYIATAGPLLLEKLQKAIPKPNPRSAKWVSTSVPSGEWNSLKARLSSAEYHTNNLLNPVLFEETSRRIPPNAICIEIAPHGLLQAILKRSLPETCVNIALTRRGHPDNLEVLLQGLGKMYNIGLQPQIANLYPKIQYPVSTGTPPISPLVKWDHSADWNIIYFSNENANVKQGEIKYEIDLNNEEHQYLRGNVINGKVAIPLSLCLTKAWEIFESFNNEETHQNIVFEDIKTHKMLLTVPHDNILTFIVAFAKGSGRFEVIHSIESINDVVITGLIKSTQAASQDRLDIRRQQVQDNYEVNQEEFYTEMSMRGFQYSGVFKTVLKSSIDGNNGLIKWMDDWVLYIDSALQLYAFGNDSRQVEMPLTIRKIVIDLKLQENEKDTEGVNIFINKKVNYLSAGGLEIQGLKFAVVPKSLEQNKLSCDVLNVVPNIENCNLSLSSIVRLMLQLVLENTFSPKIQRLNIIAAAESPKNKNFSSVLLNIPEASLFSITEVPYNKATFKIALTVITNGLESYDFKEIANKLNEGKFLLTFIVNVKEHFSIAKAESVGLKVVFIRRFENESLVLFRKAQQITNVRVLNVSKNIQESINKIKNARTSESERIVLIVKSRDQINFVDLVDQLEQAVNLKNVRVFYVQDFNESDNTFGNTLYKSQLELDLLINILTSKNQWSTLRRTAVVLKPKMSKNWQANQMCAYDPTNIIWTEGPVVENSGSAVAVEYASINSQDILIAHGNFYSDPSEMIGKNRLSPVSLGLEYSGLDANGNKIMGIVCGNSLSNFVNADAGWTWAVPKSWSLEDAATVPLSYIIAYSSLLIKAEIKEGEKVIIANSSDGVGLALLHIAIAKKCDVFVIYETEREKNLIRSTFQKIPKDRFFKLSTGFRDNVLLKTHGQGVDVVISNQCEVKELEVFFTMLNRNARVVLINDLEENKIHESVGMEIFLRELNLFSVIPKRVLLGDLETKKTLINLLQDGINTGTVKPLSRTVYHRDELKEAFNVCLTNRNLGKIVIKVESEGSAKNEALATPRLYCPKEKSYLIIEGLSPFGLELIDLLITRGARRFVVASSSKTDSNYKKLRLNLWRSYGVQISLYEDIDLSQQKNIKALIKEASSLGPVDGIFDLRRIDVTRTSVSNSDLTTQMLDAESRTSCPNLTLFIICSAITNTSLKKLRNVDIATQIIEEIVVERKKQGLPCQLIRWGLLDSTNTVNTCVNLPPVTKYLQKLDEILGTEEPVTEVLFAAPVSEVEEEEVDLAALNKDEREMYNTSLHEQYGAVVNDFVVIKI